MNSSRRKILGHYPSKQPQWETKAKKGGVQLLHSYNLIIYHFRYLATITVDNVQYKTYPQTYSSKEEAEEAVSDLAIKKLGSHASLILSQGVNTFCVGVTDLNIEPTLRITKDLFIYAKRVTEILGK